MTSAEVPNLPTGFINLSSAFFKFACHTAHRSARDPATALPICSVLHATAALEAFANEEIEIACLSLPGLREPLVEKQDLDIRSKWHEVPNLLFGRTFNRGDKQFQKLYALVELRNALVHYAPETQPMNVMPELAALLSRYNFIRPDGFDVNGAPLDWTEKLLTPECARWACETARTMVLGWHDLADCPVLRADADHRWSLAYLDGREPPRFVAREPHGEKRKTFELRADEPLLPEAVALLEAVSKATLAERQRRDSERRARIVASWDRDLRKRAGLRAPLYEAVVEHLSPEVVAELEAAAQRKRADRERREGAARRKAAGPA